MVELPTDFTIWFEETYSGASLSWVLSLLATEFKNAHSITPQELAAIGAKELKRRVEENLE